MRSIERSSIVDILLSSPKQVNSNKRSVRTNSYVMCGTVDFSGQRLGNKYPVFQLERSRCKDGSANRTKIRRALAID